MKKRGAWQVCNVLDARAPGKRRVWTYARGSADVVLTGEADVTGDPPAYPDGVRKDWSQLWRPRCNIAWMPADHVFLRLARFPDCDDDELASMVELQLEKLSPLPVGQVVWTVHPLGDKPEDELRTVLVVIVDRQAVEVVLDGLDEEGYPVDRLDFPFVDQLLLPACAGDGVWIFPAVHDPTRLCGAAWRVGGRLRHLGILHLPEGPDAAEVLAGFLDQTAMAGEMEGWLEGDLPVHLIARPEVVAELEPGLSAWAGGAIDVMPPGDPAELSKRTARRHRDHPPAASLVPPEATARQKQQWVDAIWMKGLGAVIALYLVGVVAWFGWLQYAKFRNDAVQAELKSLTAPFKEAQQLKSRIEIVREQLGLKFAALDCWAIVSELLPAGLFLTDLQFQDGRSLTLTGMAPPEAEDRITEFNKAMRGAEIEGRAFFSFVDVERKTLVARNREQVFRWTFTCELNRELDL